MKEKRRLMNTWSCQILQVQMAEKALCQKIVIMRRQGPWFYSRSEKQKKGQQLDRP